MLYFIILVLEVENVLEIDVIGIPDQYCLLKVDDEEQIRLRSSMTPTNLFKIIDFG